MTDIINEPIRFLGATVLSFNTSLGLGSAQESSLNVDLIEDCENGDLFLPAENLIEVGAPVYFSTCINNQNYTDCFNFGGVLTNWTETQGGSGKTYNVKVVDPRQLLENAIVIIDSYVGNPVQVSNYFNVYAAYEREVLDGNCDVFGSSWSTERGTPYFKIINKLQQMNPTLCSPTGYNYTINFNSFPQNIPEYYRVPGPSITVLQLLQDVCNVLGLEFYVTLLPGNIINIGTIDMKVAPQSFEIISSPEGIFNGIATELSYGEELRNEKTKALLFGEKQHYLSPVHKFNFYFGEEWDGNEFIPVVPHAFSECYGFWIKKRIKELNLTLNKPLPNNGPYTISEHDIRGAMASYDVWFMRVANDKIKGGLNAAVRQNYGLDDEGVRRVFNEIMQDPNIDAIARYKALADVINGPFKGKNLSDLIISDLQAIHQFVQNLGTTYYGKQFFTKLNEQICYYRGEKFQEKIFSSDPTNAGGWVDYGIPVLGLGDPDLGTFRETDDRIGTFAIFVAKDQEVPPEEVDKNYGEDPWSDNSYGPEGPVPE